MTLQQKSFVAFSLVGRLELWIVGWMEQTIQFSGLLSNHGIDDDSCIGTNAPHNFTGINTGFDFNKYHRKLSKPYIDSNNTVDDQLDGFFRRSSNVR